MPEIGFHPVCLLFPAMPQDDLQELADDIKANGQAQDIIAWDNQICDGRNRFEACRIAGVEPRIKHLDAEPTVEHLVSLNLKRRHLTTSQRAMLATELLPFFEAQAAKRKAETQFKQPVGTNGHAVAATLPGPQKQGESAENAAAAVGVGARSVRKAKKVKAKSPELAAKVAAGEVTVSAAERELAPDKVEATSDELGNELPDYLLEVFKGRELFWKASGLVRELRDLIHEIASHPVGMVIKRDTQPQGSDTKIRYRLPGLEQINHLLKATKPYTLCPYCADRVKAKPPKDCKQCNGSGWCTKRTYDGYAEFEKAMT